MNIKIQFYEILFLIIALSLVHPNKNDVPISCSNAQNIELIDQDRFLNPTKIIKDEAACQRNKHEYRF